MRLVGFWKYISARQLAADLTEKGYPVSDDTVLRWKKEGKPDPRAADKLYTLLGIRQKAKEPPVPPEWVEGLVKEIRMNRAVIQAAFAVGDPGFVQRVLARLAAQEEPTEQPDDEAPVETDAAT